MHGHLPGSPQPHFPDGLGPFVAYVATREPRPLEDRPPEEPGPWLEDAAVGQLDDFDDLGDWEPHHRPLIRAVAVLVSAALVLGGLGTVFEVLLSAR